MPGLLIAQETETNSEYRVPESGSTLLWGDWSLYEKLDELLSGTGARVRFLGAVIEIMAPHSTDHEFKKGIIGCLVETYCRIEGIRFSTFGNMTLKDEAKEAGGEPDECYCFHENKDYPDLAIEVALTSGGLNKLAFYDKFEIPEVWIWRGGKLTAYVRNAEAGGYTACEESAVLPGLMLADVEPCAALAYTSDAIAEFERRIAG
ncbi:MAG: Uma2 family endonuclease [Verrucomicrobiales bacterium]